MRLPNKFTTVGDLVAVEVNREDYLKVGSLSLPAADNGTSLEDALGGNITDKELSSQGVFRIPVHGVVHQAYKDLLAGDIVFFSKSESKNCETGKLDDGREIFFLGYDKLFLYKRGDEVVMLNGYLLGRTRTEMVMNVEVRYPTEIVITNIGEPNINRRTGVLSAKDVLVGDIIIYALPSERFIEQSHTHILGVVEPLRIVTRDYILGIKR
jgi:hypothetical protein